MSICGAPRRSDGLPCQSPPMVGTSKCYIHGGASPAAKIKSEQMLAQARLPACEALFTIIHNWEKDTCPTCHFPSGDLDQLKLIVRASQVILDRTGLGPRATIEVVKQNDGDIDLDACTEYELSEMDRLLGELATLKTQIRERVAIMIGRASPQPEGVM